MDRDVRVMRARGDRKWMPLVVADLWAVKEEPLSGLILHAGFGELDLNSIYSPLASCLINGLEFVLTVWVADDFDNLSLSPLADLTVETVEEIQAATDKLPSPALVTDAVGPEVLLIEWRKRGCSITNEATGCMRVHAE